MSTYSLFGTPKMILPYEWILENVEEAPMTIASKMISFRGEKVFRVGLQNHAKSPILFLVAIDLGKIGMRVEDVKYGIQGIGLGPATMMEMTNENIDEEDGSLQLFKILLDKQIVGNCTFAFRICIEQTYYFYSYQLCDRLAKNQLWAALKNHQHLADVVFIVKDKTFPAHKAILAARSRVFADEFMKKQPVNDVPQQIRIDGVEPSTVENFLHFIYTGELMGTMADEDLRKLADRYELTTLTGLFEVALKKVDPIQMGKFMASFNDEVEGLDSSKIMPEKDTEIFFDRTTPTFRCDWQFYGSENEKSQCVMQYQKEDLFFAHFTGHRDSDSRTIIKPAIHFASAKHRRFGLKVEDIYCGTKEILSKWNMPRKRYIQWLKMESNKLIKNREKNKELLHFTIGLKLNIDRGKYHSILDIKTISTIGNYYYEVMDKYWLENLWLAAINQKLTDVEIFVGTVKMMEVHRVILCARSPILNSSLNKISNTAKSIVTFGAEFDVEVVRHFLNFLYTGRLESSAISGHQLSRLASMYEVETLKNVCQPCQLFNANSTDGMDVEELTDYLLQL